MATRRCPQCGKDQPEGSTAAECEVCGSALPETPPAGQSEALVVSAATPADVPPPPPAELEAGKRACPECGEVLYETEQRCWRCGHEFGPGAAASAAPPAPAPGPAPSGPTLLPPPPGVPTIPTGAPSPLRPPPAGPGAVAPPPPPPLHPNAQTIAIWALVLSLLGLVPCLAFLAPIGLGLGVKANRTGRNSLGTTAIVLGAIGCVVLTLLLIGLLAGNGDGS